MRVAITALALGSVLLCSAHAEDASPKDVLSALEALGFKQTESISAASCRVAVEANQEEVLKSLPLLKKMEVLNEDMTLSDFRRAPTKTTMAIAMQMATMEIKAVYDSNPAADKCLFQHVMISNDEYGNPKKDGLFSYTFDRFTYKKINWDKFETQNLIKVSRDFKFNPAMASRINGE